MRQCTAYFRKMRRDAKNFFDFLRFRPLFCRAFSRLFVRTAPQESVFSPAGCGSALFPRLFAFAAFCPRSFPSALPRAAKYYAPRFQPQTGFFLKRLLLPRGGQPIFTAFSLHVCVLSSFYVRAYVKFVLYPNKPWIRTNFHEKAVFSQNQPFNVRFYVNNGRFWAYFLSWLWKRHFV